MDAETLLRRALNALNSTPSFGIFEGEKHTTSYKLAADIDRYFEPRISICEIETDEGRYLGIGSNRAAALLDAASQEPPLKTARNERITYRERVLRAGDPTAEVPEAE